MKKRVLSALLLVVLLGAGCAAKRSCFDCVQPGMTRAQVIRVMGPPLDITRNAMHWQAGDYTDAWVFFDAEGSRVVGKHWQDPDTLRLDEIWPLLPPSYRDKGK